MTESEWLSELKTAQSMVQFLLKPCKVQRTKLGRRKLRLYACGCCRIIWNALDAEDRRVVNLAERFADSEMSKDQMFAACREQPRTIIGGNLLTLHATAAQFPYFCVEWTASDCAIEAFKWHFPLIGPFRDRQQADATQCQLVRDIFGNPFRALLSDSRWRTSTVIGLARNIYDEHAWELMPILNDALMDIGCDSEEILSHCRERCPHVRGCWVIDRILGFG